MTTLTFLRHATAQDRSLPIEDHARELTNKGREQVLRVAAFCRKHDLVPVHLFCSPLIRAQQTAEILHKNLPASPRPRTVAWLAGTAPESMIAELKKLADEGLKDIWLTGHEPDFSATISLLLGSQDVIIKVKKASLIRLEVDFQDSQENQLLWSIPNALLK